MANYQTAIVRTELELEVLILCHLFGALTPARHFPPWKASLHFHPRTHTKTLLRFQTGARTKVQQLTLYMDAQETTLRLILFQHFHLRKTSTH